MGYTVRTRQAPGVTGLDATLYVLEDGAGAIAEVWPALGFNCFRWSAVRGGQTLDLLYSDPAMFNNGRPTRGGIPVLFPFPNRIRAGRFSWAGKDYQLPLNDSTQKNAIHGFACRKPWRVAGSGADAESAWVKGVFRCSLDAPECLALWPADHEIALTLRLGRGTLRVEAEVRNPSTVPLPFGLGYHPYFRLPFAGSGNASECTVEVPASAYWALADSLPTGETIPVDAKRDLNKPRPFGELDLDDVLTGLPARAPQRAVVERKLATLAALDDGDGLIERAAIVGANGGPMRLFCSPAFREMVVFTPPHRQAFCVEPYTCTTDAINLRDCAVDAGWLVLQPGATWSAMVELWV
jgi:aldose 1-epimerase